MRALLAVLATATGLAAGAADFEILWTRAIAKEDGVMAAWPTVCKCRSGEVIAAFSGDRKMHTCPWGKNMIVRSKDNGETWTKPEIAHSSVLDDRDTGILELDDGTLLLNWFSSICFRNCKFEYGLHFGKIPLEESVDVCGNFSARSTDGGRTWERPVRMYGSANHGGIQLKDGRVMVIGRHGDVPNGDMIHPLDPEFGHVPYRLVAEVSEDRGKSWKILSDIVPQAPYDIHSFHEPHLIECSDGRICAFFRCHQNGVHITQCDSADGGRTWGPMRDLPMKGAHPPHLLRLRDGRVILTYANRGTPKTQRAVVSADECRTWSTDEIVLSSIPSGDVGYPSTVELDDGSLLTVFYQPEAVGERPTLMATKWRLKGK